MKKFLAKNSLYLTSIVAIGILVYLISQWTILPVLQKLVCFMFLSITVHEWEEKLFGFGELNAQNLNVSADAVDNNIGHFALFLLTLYVGLVPLFFPDVIWLSATAMVLGILELFAHIAAIRMNKSGHFYTSGMATAFTILPVISIYGFYYIISHSLMEPVGWLFAVLNLMVPLIIMQFISVKSMGANYREFIKNAFASMKSK